MSDEESGKENACHIVSTLDDAETLVHYTICREDAELHRKLYEEALTSGTVDDPLKFQYAWCLVHSCNRCDYGKASEMLEELFKDGNEKMKRDSLFYLAVLEAKRKSYAAAKKYVDAFLSVEPNNMQAEQLQMYIQSKMENDGITGMALFGAAALFGGVVAVAAGVLSVGAAVGFALKKRYQK